MSKSKNFLPAFIVGVLVLTSIFTASRTASAKSLTSASSLALMESACLCGPERHQEITQLKNEIAAAKNVNQARQMALAPTEAAIEAIQNARSLMPFSNDLLTAESRLSEARSRILAASSQEIVADEFSGMMLAGLDDNRAAQVNVGKVGCNYSTGEVIAIVIGLILGIIPGLILLVVLC